MVPTSAVVPSLRVLNILCKYSPQVPWPYYLINTRDCFTHHLVPITTTVTKAGRTYLKTEYFFRRVLRYTMHVLQDHLKCVHPLYQ